MENSDISHMVDERGMFKKGSSEEIEKLQLFEALQNNAGSDMVDDWIAAMEKKAFREKDYVVADSIKIKKIKKEPVYIEPAVKVAVYR